MLVYTGFLSNCIPVDSRHWRASGTELTTTIHRPIGPNGTVSRDYDGRTRRRWCLVGKRRNEWRRLACRLPTASCYNKSRKNHASLSINGVVWN